MLGIDVGGSGIKGGIVDSERGVIMGERYRLATPHPATPKSVTKTVARVVEHFAWKAPVGAGFPAVVSHGQVYTAANINDAWIGRNVRAWPSTCGRT